LRCQAIDFVVWEFGSQRLDDQYEFMRFSPHVQITERSGGGTGQNCRVTQG
jgi:hypothetical protein